MSAKPDSIRSILYALFANLSIAIAKAVAAFWTGSGAMTAEAIHSLADSCNQLLLLLGMKQSVRPADKNYRTLYLTCGGCCGRALHRKLNNLIHKSKNKEGITKDKIVVKLSSCTTKDSFHGPACPHLDYLKELIGKLKLDICEHTSISKKAEKRRERGVYKE